MQNLFTRWLSIAAAALCASARGADGDLDFSFNGSGKVTTQLSETSGEIADLVVQPDGKIVAAGYASISADAHFALARYHPDGTLDSTFGDSGKAVTVVGRFDRAAAVVLLEDQKILAAGLVNPASGFARFALVRYTSDGAPDPSFGAGGIVTTSLSNGDGIANDLTVQRDGKIVLAGARVGGAGWRIALARYQPDGTLDETFGQGGTVLTSISSFPSAASVVELPDGTLIVGGSAMDGRFFKFVVLRYLPDGKIDNKFGVSGAAMVGIPDGNLSAARAIIDPQGRIMVIGEAQINVSYDVALARFLPDGALDASFATNGLVLTDFSDGDDHGADVALQSDGRIVVGAHIYSPLNGNNIFAVARYTTTGTLDATFGEGGIARTQFGANDFLRAVVVQSDAKIIAGGSVTVPPTFRTDWAIARYIATAAPAISSVRAEVLGGRSAQLHAVVNPQGADSTPQFRYGLTADYGSMAATEPGVVRVDPKDVTTTITGLLPHTVYHYAVSAMNSVGESVSNDFTFTTANTPPAASADVVHPNPTPESGINLDVLRNDSDADGDELAIANVTQGLHGTTSTDGRTIRYMPAADYTGNDAFTYTVTDGFGGTATAEVKLQNIDPVAEPDALITNGESVSIDLSTNDIDADGDALSVIEVVQGMFGGVTLEGNVVTYTPGPNYFGRDSFSYAVSDLRGARVTGAASVRSSAPLYRATATKGDQVFGQPQGSSYTKLGLPSSGLFIGAMNDPSGVKSAALFSEGGTVLLKVGDPAPMLVGGFIAAISQPAGDAVLVILQKGRGGVQSSDDTVLYTGLTSGAATIVAREGDVIGLGSRLFKFEAFDGTGSTVFFLAQLTEISSNGRTRRALCVGSQGEAVRILVRSGDTVDGRLVGSIETIIPAAGSPAEGRWRAGANAIGVKLTFEDRTQGIYTIRASSQVPDDWKQWSTSAAGFGLPGFTAGGAAFTQKTAALADEPSAGLVVRTNLVQLLSLREVDGDVSSADPFRVPDADGIPIQGVFFKKFAAPVNGATPRIAFGALLEGDSVSKQNRSGIWHIDDDGVLKLLARAGAPAVGGGLWRKFESLVLPDSPESGPIFTASVTNGSRNERGLWAVGSSGIVHLLLRTGLPIRIGASEHIVRRFVALETSSSSAVARGYDDDRHVHALVAFSDGSEMLLSIAIP